VIARRIKLAFGGSLAFAAWCAQPGTWRTAAWVVLIATLSWCATPANAATVYTCGSEIEVPFQNDAGAICGGTYAVLDESAVTPAHAVLSCRGGSTVDGDPWSVCQTNGGYYGFIFAESILATDLVERDNTGTFGIATGFSFYSEPEEPPPDDDDEFDVSELDPLELAAAFGAGWVLVAMALAVGMGFNVILGVLRKM
jgi:hypothetical protein